MTYDSNLFLESHPVFRQEEFVQEMVTSQGLAPPSAKRRAQSILRDLCRERRIRKIRNGLFATEAVMKEAPDWLPYLVAGQASFDAVLGLQAALWLHLGNPPPQHLHIFSSRSMPEFQFPPGSKGQVWTIIPRKSKLGPTHGQDPASGPGIIQCHGRFPGYSSLAIRATTEERTLVDILDGIDRRPRKSAKASHASEGTNDSDFEDESGEDSTGWAFPAFRPCWEALSSEDFNLSCEDLLLYLEKHSRSKTTTAKVRFFLTIHKERFGIRGKDLRGLSNLPVAPHYWARATEGTLIDRLKLVVPNCLIPIGFTRNDQPKNIRDSRLKPGIQVPGTDLGEELKREFGKYGIREFRDGQKAIVSAVLEGRDAIAILPTGAGKSLTYQFPSTLLEGPTLVISPLVSLIHDQVREARKMDLVAYSLQEAIKPHELEEVDDALETWSLNLLFASPESWPHVLDHWPQLRHQVAQIVVDEAHLINSWGQDFRFDYQKLGRLREAFPGAPVLALTATATPAASQRIIKELGLRDGMEIQKFPVKRPRLYLSRELTPGDFESRYKALLAFIEPRRGTTGIVYCTSRRDTEKLVEKLRKDLFKKELEREGITKKEWTGLQEGLQVKIQSYHAGMTRNDRETVQQDFMMDSCSLMVATVAFGMGVNKEHIRFVAHFGSPPSIENYVQEVGRGGRDAFWAECLLIHAEADWVKWGKRLEKAAKRIKTDESSKGRRIRDSRLARNYARREELYDMQRFVKDEGCLHQKIERHFFDRRFDKDEPRVCGRSCDHCFSPQEHRILMEHEMASLEPRTSL